MERELKSSVPLSSGRVSQLHIAADLGEYKLAQNLVQSGKCDLEAHDKEGCTALFRGVVNGHYNIVKILLRSKANPNANDEDDVSPISQAASMGRMPCLRLLLKAKADIKSVSTFGHTALHGACLNDQTRSIQLLLNSKADPTKTTRAGIDALYIAAERGNIPAIKLLVKAKADINASGKEGITPLMRAAYQGHAEAVKTLVSLGANVWLRGLGQCAVNWAKRQCHDDIAQFLQEKMRIQSQCLEESDLQTNSNSLGPEDFTPFHHTAEEEDSTPLHRAAEAGDVKLINKLIELKADIEAKDATKRTPLFLAVLADKPTAVARLLKAGANVDSPNNDGATPLHQACKVGSREIIELLIKGGANIEHNSTHAYTPLHAACLRGRIAAVEMLVKYKANVNALTRSNVSALHMAAEQGCIDTINILVGARANVNSHGPDGFTPLMQAAYKNHASTVKLLLDLGADSSLVGRGRTALQWAEKQGHLEVVAVLEQPRQLNDQIGEAQGVENQPESGDSVPRSHNKDPIFSTAGTPLLEDVLKSCGLHHRFQEFVDESLDIDLLISLNNADLHSMCKQLGLNQGEFMRFKTCLRALRSEMVAHLFEPSPYLKLASSMTVRGYVMNECCKYVDQLRQKTPQTPRGYSEPVCARLKGIYTKTVKVVRSYVANHENSYHYGPGSRAKVYNIKERDLESVGRRIGQGNQGTVSLAMWTFEYALKWFEDPSIAEREANLWARIPPHPNVAQLVAVVRGWDNRIARVLMDYYPLGSLEKNWTKIGEDEVVPGVRGLARALLHLHCLGIVHRDIASRNVLLTKAKQFVLADFGLSVVGEDHLSKDEKLPWRILAPEILKARQEFPKSQPKPVFTASSDMWAFGILLWELCNAEVIHANQHEGEVAKAILGGTWSLPMEKMIRDFPDLVPVLLGCLRLDPDQRLNAAEVLVLLQSPERKHRRPGLPRHK